MFAVSTYRQHLPSELPPAQIKKVPSLLMMWKRSASNALQTGVRKHTTLNEGKENIKQRTTSSTNHPSKTVVVGKYPVTSPRAPFVLFCLIRPHACQSSEISLFISFLGTSAWNVQYKWRTVPCAESALKTECLRYIAPQHHQRTPADSGACSVKKSMKLSLNNNLLLY